MNRLGRDFVLAIEPAINGGEVSLLKSGEVIDFNRGTGGVSKSEELILLIEQIFARQAINGLDIGLVVCSDEPGSLTGLRIGAATAQGLADSFSAESRRISLFEAYIILAGLVGELVVCFGDGDDKVFSQDFTASADNGITHGEKAKRESIFGFVARMENNGRNIVMSEDLKEKIESLNVDFLTSNNARITVIEGSAAATLGRAGERQWDRKKC